MGDKKYPGRPTRPKDRAVLAPISSRAIEDPPSTRPAIEEAEAFARDAEDQVETQTRCPVCRGSGMVTREVEKAFEQFCAEKS